MLLKNCIEKNILNIYRESVRALIYYKDGNVC